MFHRVAYLLSITVFWVGLTASAVAQTSQLIPFSGTAPGQPDGPTDLTFKLYDADSGGSYLGYTDAQGGVYVAGESFYTVLGVGSGGSVPTAPFANNSSVYIAIELTSVPGTEIAARVPLYASGFALFAHRANTAQTAVSAQTAQTAMTAQTFNPGTSVSGNLVGAALSLSNTHPSSGIGITAQSASSGGTAGLFINSAGDLLQGKTNPVGPSVFRVFGNGGAFFSGNVGIGTATPLARLHVNGDAFIGAVALGNFGVGVGWGTELNIDSGCGGCTPTTGGRFKITQNGNVGIGRANPTAKLDVAGTTQTQALQVTAGVAPNGGGLKHRRVQVTLQPVASGALQINWATPFQDSNYTVMVTVEDLDPNVGPLLSLSGLFWKTPAGVRVIIRNSSAIVKSGSVNLIAIHD